jgi:putative ABC transport system ATP-binding protein
MIEVKNITKTYGGKDNPFVALDNVSCKIPDGARVAIVGKSGSGKSTLMHVMSGLDRPEKGEVWIGGRDILRLGKNKIDEFRAHEMAFVFQSFFVQGNETCFENVSLPLEINDLGRGEIRNKVEKALKIVDLTSKKDQRAANLSGGQKQRLAIARAIVNEPKILFADEPTGNLDSMNGQNVIDTLFKISRENGTTLIIVTHDPDLASRCDMQIHIVDGQIDKIAQKKGVKNA